MVFVPYSLLLLPTVIFLLHVDRFLQAVHTRGYIAADGHAHCISPLLYQIGIIPFDLSIDGGETFPWSAAWFSGNFITVIFPRLHGLCSPAYSQPSDLLFSFFPGIKQTK